MKPQTETVLGFADDIIVVPNDFEDPEEFLREAEDWTTPFHVEDTLQDTI